MTLSITTVPGLDPAAPVGRREAAALAGIVLQALDLAHADIELLLVDDARMAALHRDFMGRAGPTNVLSFPDDDPEAPDRLGQVALSVDTLLREADLYGQSVPEHMARLLAHAFLHLAGLDHSHEMDALTDAAVDAFAAQWGVAGAGAE